MKPSSSASHSFDGEKLRKILVFLVPFVYFALLCNSITGELFWSDDPEEMDFVRKMPFLRLLFGHDAFGYFRPVKNLIWIVFAQLAPFGVEWCHVLAVGVGILSFFAVRSLCLRIFENEWESLVAAVVWLFSPTLVSSVAWLSCVNVRIMVAFASLAIVFHDQALDGGSFRPSHVFFAGVFLFLALVSYECAVAVPFVLIAFDGLLRPERFRKREIWRSHAFYWAVTILYLVLRHFVAAIGSAGGRWIQASRGQLILSSPYFTAQHFADWFWPFNRFSVGGSYVWGDVSPAILAGCAFFGIAVVASAVHFRKRFPALCFCVFFALLGFAPTSNCLGFGNGPFGDYYIALASVGLAAGCVEAVWLLAQVRGSWRVPALGFAVLFVLVRAAAIPEAARWSRFWSNDRLAYAESFRNRPESLQNQLGELRHLVAEGRWDEVLELGNRVERKVGPASSFMRFVYVSRILSAALNQKSLESALSALEGFSGVADERENAGEVSFYRGVIAEVLENDLKTAEREYGKALAESADEALSANCRMALARIEAARSKD